MTDHRERILTILDRVKRIEARNRNNFYDPDVERWVNRILHELKPIVEEQTNARHVRKSHKANDRNSK